MADAIATINNLAADPAFLALAPEEQKTILGKVRGQQAAPVQQGPLQTGSGMLTGTGISPQNPAASPNKTNFIIDMLRPLLAGTAGGAGGSLAGPPGAVAGYGGVDAILQHLKTKSDNGMVASATGMEPGGLPATLTNSAEQFGLGKLGEGLINRGKATINAFRNVDQPELMKLLPTTSQALEGSGYSKLAHVTKAAEDLAIGNKNRALNRTAGAGFSEALDLAKRNELGTFVNPQEALAAVESDIPFSKGMSYQPLRKGQSFQASEQAQGVDNLAALDRVIADPTKLQATLSRAAELGTNDNLRRTLAGYKFSDIMNKATTRDIQGNIVKLDSKKLADEWTNPEMQESFSKLYSNKNKADIDQFFKNVVDTQDKISSNTYRKLWLLEGGVGLGASLLTGSPIHGAGGMAGVYVGSQALSRLLTNPKTARIAVALAGGEPLGVSDQLAGRLLTRALQGSTVALINNDGSKTPGTFGPSGAFEPATH